MTTIILNGKKIQAKEDSTILQVLKDNNINISTLCYLKDCMNLGKCGVCLTEVNGKVTLACNTKIKEGMIINTESEEVKERLKKRISQLLDTHELKCSSCPRQQNCEFLKLVIQTKAKASKPFLPKNREKYVDSRSKAIVFDRTKCILCGRCVAACKVHSGTSIIKFMKKDGKRIVGIENNPCLDNSNCLLCGQCVVACPVGALTEKTHIPRVQQALNDPKKHVIVAMAPSVRASIGELFNMGFGKDVTGKIYTALRMLNFDKIFDINFAADITIIEEATELLERIKNGGLFQCLHHVVLLG